MPLETLALIGALFTGAFGSAGPGSPAGSVSSVVELGLTSPLERLEDLVVFRRDLAERLVWTVREEPGARAAGEIPIRFTAVRVDRGRVTASYQSDPRALPRGLSRIAESLGPEAFLAFPDVCMSPEDPPATVRALSGRAQLDSEGLERAIASAARTRDLGDSFGLDEPVNLEWGRHVVLILAASSEDSSVRVRPLILILERK